MGMWIGIGLIVGLPGRLMVGGMLGALSAGGSSRR